MCLLKLEIDKFDLYLVTKKVRKKSCELTVLVKG